MNPAHLMLAANVVTNQLASWAGGVTGARFSQLLNAIKFARIQLEVARRILDAMPADAPVETQRATLKQANDLVRTSRENVTRAAFAVGTAVPEAVVNAFADWERTAVAAGKALGEGFASTMFLLLAGAFVLYQLGKRGGKSLFS